VVPGQSVTGLTKKLKTHLLSSFIFTTIVAGLPCVFGYFTQQTVILLPAIWAVAFALLANAHKIFPPAKKD